MIKFVFIWLVFWTCPSFGSETVQKQCDETSVTGIVASIDVLVSLAKEYLKTRDKHLIYQQTDQTCPLSSPAPTDCADVLLNGHTTSGSYRIWPKSWMTTGSFNVYCDMDTDGGGWTVIQRRGNHGNPKDYIFRPWADYKVGFGAIQKEFWLGDSFGGHNEFRFTAKDKDNDTDDSNCVQAFKGAWWCTNYHGSNLNGLYLNCEHESYAVDLEWSTWRGQ